MRRRNFAAIVTGLALCIGSVVGASPAVHATGRTSPQQASPIKVPGWSTEQVWNRSHDDWEPTIVASNTDGWAYQATTRFGAAKACKKCPGTSIVLRRSRDGGHTWDKRRYLCACPGSQDQYDPQLAMSDDGSVYAAWLNGYKPGVTFSVSHDHAVTWSTPVSVPTARWSDKPVLVVSHDGMNVFLAFNGPTQGDSWVAQSHDGGINWTARKVVGGNRYYFAGAAWISADGTKIVFAEVDDNQTYTGVIHVDAIVSADSGATWKQVRIDTVARQPDCTSSSCYDGFYASVPWVAGDATGNLAFFYVGSSVPAGPQRLYVRRSHDGGLTWSSKRNVLSPLGANAVSPAAAGDAAGMIRLWWMDDRTGRFNVWYRQWDPRRSRWSKDVRISNRRGGAPYKNAQGFGEDYGDYGGITINYLGQTLATWAEAPSYAGPGGTWFNIQK
jgi:hypothetical protein